MTGHEVGAALGVAVLSAVATAAGSLTDPAGVVDGFTAAFAAAAVIAAGLGVVAYRRMPAARMTVRQPCTCTTEHSAGVATIAFVLDVLRVGSVGARACNRCREVWVETEEGWTTSGLMGRAKW